MNEQEEGICGTGDRPLSEEDLFNEAWQSLGRSVLWPIFSAELSFRILTIVECSSSLRLCFVVLEEAVEEQ